MKVRIDSGPVSLWAVSTSDADEEFDRFVMVGEAAGRWLWLVLHPASAMLLMRDEWILRDGRGIGRTAGGDVLRRAAARLVSQRSR